MVKTNLQKETSGMYNRVNTVWSSSSLSTVNAIDFTNHNNLCFDLRYYIPVQENTGQGIYYGVVTSNYKSAIVGAYLSETTEVINTFVCIDVSGISGYAYPFIEIYNAHTMVPYDGWVANTSIYLRRVYLR